MSRYELCKFSPAPDPEFICGICMNVLDTPYETGCRHVFCRDCIWTALRENPKCPVCRSPCTENQSKEVIPLVQNLINKLTMKCDNYDSGCTELILMEFFLVHIKSCKYAMVQCRFKGCGQYLLRKDCEEHETVFCVFRDRMCEIGCGLMIPMEAKESHNCTEALLTVVKDLTEKNLQLQKKLDELRKEHTGLVQPLLPVSVDDHEQDLSTSYTSDDSSATFSSQSFSSFDDTEFELSYLDYQSSRNGLRRSRRIAELSNEFGSPYDIELSDDSNQHKSETTPRNYDNYSEDEIANRSIDDARIIDGESVDGIRTVVGENIEVITTIDNGNIDEIRQVEAKNIDEIRHVEGENIDEIRHVEGDNINDIKNIEETPEYHLLSENLASSEDSQSGLHNEYIDGREASTKVCSQTASDSGSSSFWPDFSGSIVSPIQISDSPIGSPSKRPLEDNGEVSNDNRCRKKLNSHSHEYKKTHLLKSSSVSNTSNAEVPAKKHPHGHKKAKAESLSCDDSQTPSNSGSSLSITGETGNTSDQTNGIKTSHTTNTSGPNCSDTDSSFNSSSNTRNEHNPRHRPVTRSRGHYPDIFLEDNVIPYVKVPPTVAYLLNKYAREDDSSDDESWSPSHGK